MDVKSIVAAIKAEFPGFDRPLLVKCGLPDRYGIQLIKRAQELRDGQAAPEPRDLQDWNENNVKEERK